MTTTQENARPLPLIGPSAGDLETTIRTLDETARRVRETSGTEEG